MRDGRLRSRMNRHPPARWPGRRAFHFYLPLANVIQVIEAGDHAGMVGGRGPSAMMRPSCTIAGLSGVAFDRRHVLVLDGGRSSCLEIEHRTLRHRQCPMPTVRTTPSAKRHGVIASDDVAACQTRVARIRRQWMSRQPHRNVRRDHWFDRRLRGDHFVDHRFEVGFVLAAAARPRYLSRALVHCSAAGPTSSTATSTSSTRDRTLL